MSSITDRPLSSSPQESTIFKEFVASHPSSQVSLPPFQEPLTSKQSTSSSSSVQEPTTSKQSRPIIESTSLMADPVTPEQVHLFPKAGPRKEAQQGRNKGKSRILTSMPEKAEAAILALEM